MKQVFEEIMASIQSLIDVIEEELNDTLDPKEREYLTKLGDKLEEIVFSCQNISFDEMPYYIEIVERLYFLGGLEGKDYSEKTSYYFKELQGLYINVRNIRVKYVFKTLLGIIQQRPIKISECVDKFIGKAKKRRKEYDENMTLLENHGYMDPRLDLGRMKEDLFFAEENEKAFQSMTTVSFTKLYLENIVSSCYEMLKESQYKFIESAIKSVIGNIVEVVKTPIVAEDKNYYDLIADTINKSINLLRRTCFEGEELAQTISLLQLLRIQLEYEKQIQVQQTIERDISSTVDTSIDYNQLIDRVHSKIELESNISRQSPIPYLRTNCPSYMNLDLEHGGSFTTDDMINQFQYLDRIFLSQMALSGLTSLNKDKNRSLN